MRIEIDQNKNNAYFWRLVASNGEILSISESYASQASCKRTVKSVAKQLGFSSCDKSNLVWKKNDTSE